MILKNALAVLAAVVLTSVVGMSSAGAAPELAPRGAATTVSTASATLTVLPSTGALPSVAQQRALAPRISCTLNVHRVHPSHHITGTINGVAKVTCVGGVAGSIKLAYSLIRESPNTIQWAAGPVTVTNKATAQNNRAVKCDQGPGVFQGWAMGTIAPPAGYELEGPPVAKDYGPSYSVACGATLAGSLDPADVLSSSITVTFVPVGLGD